MCRPAPSAPRNWWSKCGYGSPKTGGSRQLLKWCRAAARRAIRPPPRPRCGPSCRGSPTTCCATKPIRSGRTLSSPSIRARCFMVDVFPEMSPRMSVTSFRLPALPLSRRDALIGGAAAGLLLPSLARAQTRLQITEGNVAPLPIAIPNFVAGTPSDGEVSVGVSQVITNNLKRSGLFAPIDQAAFIEKVTNIDVPPQFQNWKTINASALVTGRVTRQDDGRLKAEFRLWDVAAGQQFAGQEYSTSPEYWRRIAHIISDQIYERLSGEKGYFDSRVVFVDEGDPAERRIKRLVLMDQDGANVQYLTKGTNLVLTPRFSPSAQEITYVELGQGDPRVHLYNIETGQREIVGNFPGMSFSPRFSPDGQRVIMSLQQGGNSNLFVMDLRSKSTTRLTDTPAIDTSPSYAPDGTRICFESDRGGKPQIYVMPATGGPAQRVSFSKDDAGGSYSTPVWSPRGDYI